MAYSFPTYANILDGNGNAAPPPSVPSILYLNTATIASSGDSGFLYAPTITSIFMSLAITAVTGATPGIQIFYDQKDGASNILFSLQQTAKLNAAGSTYGSIGSAGNSHCLTGIFRIRWVLDAGTTNFTGTICAIGRP